MRVCVCVCSTVMSYYFVLYFFINEIPLHSFSFEDFFSLQAFFM